MTIWKFVVKVAYTNVFQLPVKAVVLHVAEQAGEVCIWVQFDEAAKRVNRHFIVIGTGHNVPTDTTYRGTAHVPPFVWHVLEVAAPAQRET